MSETPTRSEIAARNKERASQHSHIALHDNPAPLSEEDVSRQRRATRIMMVILIPIAVWTLIGLIVMWPGNVSDHLRGDTAFSQPNVTMHSAKVLQVHEISSSGQTGSDGMNDPRPAAELSVQLTDGPEAGQETKVSMQPAVYASGVQPGTGVKVYRVPIEGAPPMYQFTDFERTAPLVTLALAFVVALIVVARKRGALAIIGLAFSAFIVVKFMLPALISGASPVLVALISGSAILFVVLYITHGFSVRTTTALLGTLFGMFVATMLAWIAVKWAHLTGVTQEDDIILWSSAPDMQLTGVVICAIIVSSVGVLNDVTITQASAVWELSGTDADESRLFSRAMRIGRDHIASTVYTIAFATTGASLAAYLMLVIYNRPLFEVVGLERFSTEIIATLIGSISVILAMPLTTAIGVAMVTATRSNIGRLRPAESGASAGHRDDELLDLDTRHPDWAPPTPGEGERTTRMPKLPWTSRTSQGKPAEQDPEGPKPKRQA